MHSFVHFYQHSQHTTNKSIYLLLFFLLTFMTLQQRNGHNFLNNGPIYNLLALLEIAQCSLYISVDSHNMNSDYNVPI